METKPTEESLGVVDSSGLTDADWHEINKLKQVFKHGGTSELKKALKALSVDPTQYLRVIAAFFPDLVREAIKDSLAEQGMTEEDVRELLRKSESPARDQ